MTVIHGSRQGEANWRQHGQTMNNIRRLQRDKCFQFNKESVRTYDNNSDAPKYIIWMAAAHASATDIAECSFSNPNTIAAKSELANLLAHVWSICPRMLILISSGWIISPRNFFAFVMFCAYVTTIVAHAPVVIPWN